VKGLGRCYHTKIVPFFKSFFSVEVITKIRQTLLAIYASGPSETRTRRFVPFTPDLPEDVQVIICRISGRLMIFVKPILVNLLIGGNQTPRELSDRRGLMGYALGNQSAHWE
jgi:hypothetical protein